MFALNEWLDRFNEQAALYRSEIRPYVAIIMVVKKISIQDLKATLSAAVTEAESGHTIMITRHNRAVAQLGPARLPGVHPGDAAARGRVKPALTRGSRGRYLAVLLGDRGDR
jgi:antitoxin (DNA-binding transcriptional repressor) of toxin-antitoxin stability system